MYEKEYETLRSELNDNRKYVFERPIVIFSAACVLFNYVSDTNFAMLFPCLIVLLLVFNLHFTANRLNSNARIIAYIRLFIEKKENSPYRWETFLDAYRGKGDEQTKQKEQKEQKDLKFYPMIFYFHLVLILILLLLELMLYFNGTQSTKDSILMNVYVIKTGSLALMLGALVYLFVILRNISPQQIRKYFESETNRVEAALLKMESQTAAKVKEVGVEMVK